MSSMSYNSVYTPTAMFRQSFNPPSLHTNGTTSATSGNSYYLPQLPVNDHQPMTSHSLQQSQSTAQQWPSSTDKRNFIYQPGSGNNNSVSFSFASNYQSTNAHIMDEKKNHHGFQSQHGIQSPTNASVLPPPPGQGVQPLLSSVDNMGRNTSRPLTNSKRAAQNRAAQRAFRQRKDRYIKDLEAKAKDLDSLKKQVDDLLKEKNLMQQTIRRLEAENAKLKGEDVSDEEGRQVFGGNNSNGAGSSNSNYSHYGNSTRDDDDSQVLSDEPWSRHNNKDSGRKGGFGMNDERPGSFISAGSSSSSTSALNRPGSEYSQRSSGLVLPPGPNTDSSVDPCFRPDYRNANSHSSPSPPSSSSDRNNRPYQHNNNNNNNNGRSGYSNNEEDTDRVYDDLCELMKTRSRPDLPHNINLWPSQHSPAQQNVVTNGSSTVAG